MVYRTLLLLSISVACFALSHCVPGNLNIRAHYPDENLDATAFFALRGDGLGLSWDSGVKMSKVADNVWSVSLSFECIDVGTTVQMKILMNDKYWQTGANEIVLLPSKSASVDLFPFFFSSSGTYEVMKHELYSPELRNSRSVVVYTPPSYTENYLKVYPLLVMHDGQNLFNASTSAFGTAWLCQDTVDQLVVQGHMRELIIAGLYNTPDRLNEYTYSYDASVPGGGKGDKYLDFIVNTALPVLQKQYRVNTKEATGILGSSLGGLISCYAAWTRPEVFEIAGCMSSSFWWNNEDFTRKVMKQHTHAQNITVYLDSGNAGPDQDDVVQTQEVRAHFQQLGFEEGKNLFYYLDDGGQHSEYFWGKRFWSPMSALYPPQATQTIQTTQNNER